MLRSCSQCGSELRDGIAFCTQCGAKAPETTQSFPIGEVCVSCGTPVKEGIGFCTSCGVKKGEKPASQITQPPNQTTPPPPPPSQQPPAAASTVYQSPPQQSVQQPAQVALQQTLERSVKGTKYEPITTGGFIGIMFLLCIPIIGFILLIVWACGGCRKISKRSFARATLILAVIMAVLSLIIALVFGGMLQGLLKNGGIDTSNPVQGSSWFSDESGNNGTVDEDGALSALGEVGALLEGLAGQEGSGSGLEGLISGAEDVNKDTEANSNVCPDP